MHLGLFCNWAGVCIYNTLLNSHCASCFPLLFSVFHQRLFSTTGRGLLPLPASRVSGPRCLMAAWNITGISAILWLEMLTAEWTVLLPAVKGYRAFHITSVSQSKSSMHLNENTFITTCSDLRWPWKIHKQKNRKCNGVNAERSAWLRYGSAPLTEYLWIPWNQFGWWSWEQNSAAVLF